MNASLTKTRAWKALARHLRAGVPEVRTLFAEDAERARRFAVEFDDLYLDYSKQRVSSETMKLLFDLARQADVSGWTQRMYAGEQVNASEGRAVLHVALRSDLDEFPHGASVMRDVREARGRLRDFVDRVRGGQLQGATGQPIRTIVNLGIGGSDLGPRMVTRALQRTAPRGPEVHFVSNVDPADLDFVLARLEPETTLFIVASKTFTTAETLDNARRARAWLTSAMATRTETLPRHFAAVSANVAAARDFGVDPDQIFPFWDWVGGRFSVWSAVGLACALALGNEAFDALCDGARRMDQHFLDAPPESNLPVILALLSVWNVNFLGARSHAMLPYSEDLRDFPAYLQQLEMESNGKGVDRDGREIDYQTAPVIWGAAGTNSQHSFHQLLHQGTPFVPVDFIVPVRGTGDAQSHALLVENALAQAAALMNGTGDDVPLHARCPGNRPSSMLLMEQLTPATLGRLIALYEHKVFAQGVIWSINSFDQWGVELGKKIARSLAGAGSAAPDPSTAVLLERVRRAQKRDQ